MGDGANYVSPVPPRPPGGSSLKWLGVLVGFAVLVGVVVLQRHSGNAPAAAVIATTAPSTTSSGSSPGPTPTPTTRSGSPSPSLPGTGISAPTTTLPIAPPQSVSLGASSDDPAAGNSPTTVTTVATAALPRAAGWQIVGYGSGRLVRIDPATGRVTVHPGTSLGTDNPPQSVISATGRTYVGAWSSPGWMVPDTGVAVIAPGQLYDPSMVLPGPDAGHLWAATTQFPGDLRTVTLVDWSGHPSGSKIVVPPYLRDGYIYPDGAGFVSRCRDRRLLRP